MQRLRTFPLKDSRKVQSLRRAVKNSGAQCGDKIDLAIELCRVGCTYEAASILRPLRSHWKLSDAAEIAQSALEAQTWWNKNWRGFAHLMQARRTDDALELLGNRANLYWDLPSLLSHLGNIAIERNQLELAEHLFQRVFFLTKRGLPKMNMTAFEYVSQASIAYIMCLRGDPVGALKFHRSIKPNPGNAMSHEIQFIKLLVATGDLNDAMQMAASCLLTARKHRSGYSREIRLKIIDSAPGLSALRERTDWESMINDPAAYLRKP